MVLNSPGVQVTIIDQAQYVPGPISSTPLIIFATAANKTAPNGISVAKGTTAAEAGKMVLMTSQPDLAAFYGYPIFWESVDGTPLNGYELNEYGLLAAYSALGGGNSCYCLRADIDLKALQAKTGRPTGTVANGTYWEDTTNSVWGIYQWNSVTGLPELQSPIVLSDSSLIDGTSGLPYGYLGAVGTYAVYAGAGKDDGQVLFPSNSQQFFYKGPSGAWAALGSVEWLKSWPTVQGSVAPGPLPAGETLNISLGNGNDAAIEVRSTPGDNFVSVLAQDITALNWAGLSAAVVNGKLQIYSSQTNLDFDPHPFITISGLPGESLLEELGLEAGTYYQPSFIYCTNSTQPLWQSSQTYPAPTGSVFIKVGSNGKGMETVLEQWDDIIKDWVTKEVTFAVSDSAATNNLDASGGQDIPVGTIYGQYNFSNQFANGPVYLWRRIAEGPTVVVGNVVNPVFTEGPYTATIQVSIPGTSGFSSAYVMELDDDSNAADFVDAFNAATPLAVPFAVASLTTDGAIQIEHTEGGEIIISDVITDDTDPNYGKSNGLFATAGFDIDTAGIKYGPFVTLEYQPVQSSTTGVGTGLQIKVTNSYQVYNVNPDDIVDGGSGYVVGDKVTFLGSQMGGVNAANNLVVRVTGVTAGAVTSVTLDVTSQEGFANDSYPYSLLISNWRAFTYTPNEGAPTAPPKDFTYWYWTDVEADIMVNLENTWYGYKNVGYDANGFPSLLIVNATDPNGPILSASEPTVQSDGTPLVYGDLWINTLDKDNYPLILRWQQVAGEDKWVLLDNANNNSGNGILFADARWASNGTVNPANDPIPTIKSLLTSNYLDLDAPNADLSPSGILLFNSRRSTLNVKQFRKNYFNSTRFPDETLPNQKDAWVTVSGLMFNGAPYMGRKAQRATIVKALNAAVATNTDIRNDDNFINIIATPGYPELQGAMVELNSARGDTAFIVGDTPMRLKDDPAEIQAWARNVVDTDKTGDEGLVTRSEYMGLFYPSGLAIEPENGSEVVVPASHMVIRTLLRSDRISWPWFAPAGTTRGVIDNALNIGYVSGNEFVPIKTRIGVRDTLYLNMINPLVNFTNIGLLNYGNKTSKATGTALDRINVARLVNYLRRQLALICRPFVFEPNDSQTRNTISAKVESELISIQAKRGIYDYAVQCDEVNNPPAVVDKNELWISVAIEPVKAAEFIYVPVRIYNTGGIATSTSSNVDLATIRNTSTVR